MELPPRKFHRAAVALHWRSQENVGAESESTRIACCPSVGLAGRVVAGTIAV
jgi:hypothetical protein